MNILSYMSMWRTHTYKLNQTYLPCCLLQLVFLSPFFSFSSFFISVCLSVCIQLNGPIFFYIFYFSLFVTCGPQWAGFGLLCVRSTTRSSFWPLVPIGSIPPSGNSVFFFIYVFYKSLKSPSLSLSLSPQKE